MSTLAHYGGIDEIAVFLLPALLALWGIRWAEKRSRARATAMSDDDNE